MPRALTLPALFAATILGLPAPIHGAQQVLVVGDSLTKEYQVEFPLLFPDNPASWDSRNWIELLNIHRNAHFDLGSFDFYFDPRASGHAYNWAFPGATTGEIRERLASTSFIDRFWQEEFEDQVKNQAGRVVVFAGGNDVEDYYDDIYNGASATPFINETLDNVKWIVDRIRGMKSTIPIVLVSVPHVGCTPKVQQSCPTNAVKTARVTTALDSMNTNLAAFAQARGIGFAMPVYDMTKSLITGPYNIGGVDFIKQADMDARTSYLFSGDGFHPNSCAHARIAQMVIDAFRTRYPSPDIPAAPDTELLDWLGLEAPDPYEAWLVGLGVPANQRAFVDDPDRDGIPNLVEFLLSGMNANSNSLAAMPKPIPQNIAGQNMLTFTWFPSSQGLSFASLNLLQSSNLSTWTTVPVSNIIVNSDGSLTARLPLTGRLFLRLTATK
jgi:lysophospholipase L1-like esterase